MKKAVFSLPEVTKAKYKNRRDELVSLIVEDINRIREGTQYKKVTKKMIAIRLNSNPFYAKDDGEVQMLYNNCKARANYSKLFYDCPLKREKLSPK
jgi:hypothetical protein